MSEKTDADMSDWIDIVAELYMLVESWSTLKAIDSLLEISLYFCPFQKLPKIKEILLLTEDLYSSSSSSESLI